jgi:hypothetical protein
MKNKLSDLRNHLFETIESLKDDGKPMPVDRARAISEAAGKLIDSGKMELQYLKLMGDREASKFFDTPVLPLPEDRSGRQHQARLPS